MAAWRMIGCALLDTHITAAISGNGTRYTPAREAHLFDPCFNFTTLINSIFPRNTPEDLSVFRLVAKGLNKGRIITNSSVDPTDCGLLYRRARLLLKE